MSYLHPLLREIARRQAALVARDQAHAAMMAALEESQRICDAWLAAPPGTKQDRLSQEADAAAVRYFEKRSAYKAAQQLYDEACLDADSEARL
jgi:hypothetical protein